MSRKLILLLVAVFLIFGSVTVSLAETGGPQPAANNTGTLAAAVKAVAAQQGTVSAQAYSPSVQTLTLEGAWELALKNNIDMRKAALDYDQAIVDAEQADYNADQIDSDEISDLQKAQTKKVSSKQKELAEAAAKQAYDIAKEQTKNLVEKNYYDVLKAENMVKVNETAVKRAQEQLTLVQKKFKAGSAVKTDVDRAEISLSTARADLNNARSDLKNAQVTLNKTLGTDIDANIKLVQVLKYEKVTVPTVEALTQQALERRLDLQKAKNAETIAKLNYDLAVSYLAPNTFTARSNKIQWERAKLDLAQQEQSVRADVISTLFQVQKADESVQILAKSLDQAKDNQNLAQRRYQIGVGTFSDVLSASVDLASAEAKYVEAVYTYTLAKNQLKTVVLTAK